MNQRIIPPITLAEFAQKYLDFFERTAVDDRAMYSFFDDSAFPDECWSLGFEMDCGHSFIETCGEDAWRSVDGLRRIVDNINDVNLLGSAIFSQWRYFNHWAGCGPSEEDREWFIVIFRRLKRLSE
jgi:hypothetical protein